MLRSTLLIVLFGCVASGAHAASLSVDAQYNGAWTGVVSGMPSSFNDNTFNHTGVNPALVVIGGVAAYLDFSTNVFNGAIRAAGNGGGNSTILLANSINTITGDITVEDGCVIDLARSTNIITGTVTTNGGSYFNSYGVGNANNTLGNLIVNIGGTVSFSNTGSGAMTTTITNLSVANGGTIDFANAGSGTVANTITTLDLSGGRVTLGGNGSTTSISNLNWSGGELDAMYQNGSFGTNAIQSLNITGPVTLSLIDNMYSPLTVVPGGGPYTIFAVNNFSGNANQITLVNANPFVEVISSGSPNGITLDNSGNVQIQLVPTVTLSSNNTISTLTGALDNTVMMAIQHAQMMKPIDHYQKAVNVQDKDAFEALVTTFSETEPLMWNSSVWLMPYALGVRNSVQQNNSDLRQKNYGLLFGGSRYLNAVDMTLTGVLGAGTAKLRSEKINGKTKNLILGLVATKAFYEDKLDLTSSLYAIGFQNKQYRQGSPSPTQSYVASSRYKSVALSWQNEIGYELDLREDFLLRPNLGLQLLSNYQPAFTECNAGIYAQRYERQTSFSNEIYAGLGAHKEWFSERYEGKTVLSYEIGTLSGNRNSTVMVFAPSVPQGVNASNAVPGSTIQYLNLFGSILDKERNLRIVPGCSYSIQKGQHGLWGSLKVEHVW